VFVGWQIPPGCTARVFLWASATVRRVMIDSKPCDVHDVAKLVKGHRYNVGSECDFQRGVLDVLTRSRIACEAEYDLPGSGRIDLFLPQLRIGIELKVKGSPTQILRQLYRYARCPILASLLLISSRPRLNPIPLSIYGKPLAVLSVWEDLV